MKERIEHKIAEIVENILDKSVKEITPDDYAILANELKEIHLMESQIESRERMAELISMVPTPNSTFFNGINKEIRSEKQ